LQSKIYFVLAVLGLLLGVASPLPIWPGGEFIRHLLPGIVSAALIISACLRSMRMGSRSVGVIAMIYGALATLAGLAFTAASIIASMSVRPIEEARITIMAGLLPVSIAVLIVGVSVILLGYKTFRAAKPKD
jgi:hypothetical protein